MTPRWPSTAVRSSRLAITPPGPSAATAPSTLTTGWSPAAWKPNGTPRSARSPMPKPSSPAARPPDRRLSPTAERAAILALGDDLGQVWDAPTTTDKDRKQLLRTLLEEVNITATPRRPRPARRPDAAVERRRDQRADRAAAPPASPRSAPMRTRSTLIRRLAAHYPDAIIAGILNRQRRHHRPRNVIHRQ